MELKPSEEAKIILTSDEVRALFNEREQFPDLALEAARKFEERLLPNKSQSLAETVGFLRINSWKPLLGDEALDMPKASLRALFDRISDNTPAELEDIAELHTFWDWPVMDYMREFPVTMAPQIGRFCLLLISKEKDDVIKYDKEHKQAALDLEDFNRQYPIESKGFMERFLPRFSLTPVKRRSLSWDHRFSGIQLEESLVNYRNHRSDFISLMQVLPEDFRAELIVEAPENPTLG